MVNNGAPLSDDARRGASKASTHEDASLGLGLFLGSEIAKAHGGNVDAASANGLALVAICLPREADYLSS